MGQTMTYLVLLENRGTDYVAHVPALPGCEVHAGTEQEALEKARQAITARLEKVKVVPLEVETPVHGMDHPWLRDAGIFKDDPTWDEFQAAIAEYRREIDEVERARD